jgi:hypothetical protein
VTDFYDFIHSTFRFPTQSFQYIDSLVSQPNATALAYSWHSHSSDLSSAATPIRDAFAIGLLVSDGVRITRIPVLVTDA